MSVLLDFFSFSAFFLRVRTHVYSSGSFKFIAVPVLLRKQTWAERCSCDWQWGGGIRQLNMSWLGMSRHWFLVMCGCAGGWSQNYHIIGQFKKYLLYIVYCIIPKTTIVCDNDRISGNTDSSSFCILYVIVVMFNCKTHYSRSNVKRFVVILMTFRNCKMRGKMRNL